MFDPGNRTDLACAPVTFTDASIAGLKVVIRGGTVVDGTGNPPFGSDIGIIDGRIVSVGRLGERGAQEIDASGAIVTPGFIYCHTHMDPQFFWDPLGTCSLWHGVTTVVAGNCGFTLAPAAAGDKAMVVRNLEKAENISGAAMEHGIN